MEFSKEAKADLIDPYVDIMEGLRKGNGRPQMEIAAGVGLSEKYVALIERRERLPAFEVLLALLAEAGAPREVGENMMEELIDQFWAKNGTPA